MVAPPMSSPSPPPLDATLEVDGMRFRDLDHDGVLAPYEDRRRSPAERADDLLARMTTDEKVGLLLHGAAVATGSPLAVLGVGTGYDVDALDRTINGRGVSSLISRLDLPPADLAAQNNAVQRVAARGRRGIPVTFSTDPRHHRAATLGAGVSAAGFSTWPGPLGLAATRDLALVRRFGDVVRQEYRAVGFHMALSPQADLATSPRWPRIDGTFGEDPDLVRACVGAYVVGVQGGESGVTATGVAAVVKHWVGYGASADGFDGHNYYGRFSSFPGGCFDAHVDAFRDALAAGAAGVMPMYNIARGVLLDGTPLEEIGGGFSEQLVNGLLRATFGFDGLVLSDWAIVRDLTDAGRTGNPPQGPTEIAMPWGVEALPRVERFARSVAAGIDQFGGEDDPSALLHALATGSIGGAQLDAAARRVLALKFRLGLFDDPYVDVDAAARVIGNDEFRAEAAAAQCRSVVQLEGARGPAVARGAAVYVHGFDGAAFAARGARVVGEPDAADVAVVKMAAPYESLHPGFFFGGRQHEGSLAFGDDHPDLVALRRINAAAPATVAVVHLDRPAVLSDVREHASTLLVEFGVDVEAIAAAVCDAVPTGRLPFQLSASMDAVLARDHDRPGADPAPLYPIGAGSP